MGRKFNLSDAVYLFILIMFNVTPAEPEGTSNVDDCSLSDMENTFADRSSTMDRSLALNVFVLRDNVYTPIIDSCSVNDLLTMNY